MNWAARKRQDFITAHLQHVGRINRSDIVEMFHVKPPTATKDIRDWIKNNPGVVSYDISKKTYVANVYSAPETPDFADALNALKSGIIRPDTFLALQIARVLMRPRSLEMARVVGSLLMIDEDDSICLAEGWYEALREQIIKEARDAE